MAIANDRDGDEAGPLVDLIASVDGRWVELGRDLSDQELARVEGVISMSRMMDPSASRRGEAELRLEQESGVCRAMLFEGQIICIDLPRSGLGMTDFRQRARRSHRWAKRQWLSSELDEQQSTRKDLVPTLEDTPFLSMDEVTSIPFNADEDEGAQASSSQSPTWGKAAMYVDDCCEQAKTRLGPTVVANYWRQALTKEGVNGLQVSVGGQVKADEPDTMLTKSDGQALQAALERWLSRCRRVVPDWKEVEADLSHPPWENGPEQESRPFFEIKKEMT